MTKDGNKLVREICALLFACALALITLALYSFSPDDPGFNHQAAAGHKTRNLAGALGSYAAGGLVDLCGAASWLTPAFLALGAAMLFFPRFRPSWLRWLGGILLAALMPVWAHFTVLHLGLPEGGMMGGGFMGRFLHGLMLRIFGTYGLVLVNLCLTLVGLRLLLGMPYKTLGDIFRDGYGRIHDALHGLLTKRPEKTPPPATPAKTKVPAQPPRLVDRKSVV